MRTERAGRVGGARRGAWVVAVAAGWAWGAGAGAHPGCVASAPPTDPTGGSERAGAEGAGVRAREVRAGDLPRVELSASVESALRAGYLTEEERGALRVSHGVWQPGDLSSPALRARAALTVGAWDDASLRDPAADVEDRAEAALRRGEVTEALALVEGRETLRAARLRAAGLETLGRFTEADAAVDAAIAALLSRKVERADEVVEGARAALIRARVRGQPAREYHQVIALLGHARENLDRLSHAVPLAEAALLYEKDARSEAAEAATASLTLNPSSSGAWALLGRMAVDGFNFDAANAAADRLDALVRGVTGDSSSVSAEGSIVRALGWLRQNEPDEAEAAVAPVLAAMPKHREALAVRAAVEALRNSGPGLAEWLGRFDALSKGSPLALYTVGKALSEIRQYEAAAEKLEAAAALQPNWASPWIELGLLELQSGRDLRALDALRKATALDPFNTRAQNSLKLIEELQTYETVESEHFVVRWKPGVDGVMAREMLAPLEEIHRVVAGAIRHDPDRKTVIELLPNHEWFAVRITGMPAIHTIAACTGPVIAMEAPKVGPGHTGEYDWVRVLRHEYVHTVTLSRTRNRIPHWFTEAAAVRLEGAPRDYETAELLVGALRSGSLFDLREINIAFVRPEKPTDRAQAYAQGHWMYEFIEERWGASAPLDMMDLYAAGVRESEAMRRTLGVSGEEFFGLFSSWAREQAASWGMLAEPPIDRLLVEEAVSTEEGRSRAAAAAASMAEAFARTLAGLAAPRPVEFDPGVATPAMVSAWLARFPENPDVLEAAARSALASSGGEATAENAALLERYAAARPVDPMPHRALARLYLRGPGAAERARAIPHLEFLDVREQRTAAYAVELARLYAAERDLERAWAKAERATQIAPFDADNRELAATVALLRGDRASAERHLTALTELEPDREIHRERLRRLRERE